jgi:hypothetical protein
MAVMDYQTRDGLVEYGFSIEFKPAEGWRIYIMLDPFQKDQEGIPQLPYQSIDNDGRRYVDWPSKLDNLGDAKTVAALWAELAQRYQRVREQHEFYIEVIKRYRRTRRLPMVHNEAANDTNVSSGEVQMQPDFSDVSVEVAKVGSPSDR